MKPKSRKKQTRSKAAYNAGDVCGKGSLQSKPIHKSGGAKSPLGSGLTEVEREIGVGTGYVGLYGGRVKGLEIDNDRSYPIRRKAKTKKLEFTPATGPSSVRPFAIKFQHSPKLQIPRSGHRHKVAVHFKGGRYGKTWGQRPGRLISTGGQRIRSIVKTRWVRAGGHERHLRNAIDYLQGRERGPAEKEREFFSKDRSHLSKEDVEKGIEEKSGRFIGFHKMIISPGDNSINLQGYVRDIVAEWEKVLGQEIDYYGIIHENTDHYHAHLLIGGRIEGSTADLRFTSEQLAGLRFISDEWLARDRELDTELDRKLDIQLEFMSSRFDNMDKLLELGQHWYREWRDQVDLGMRTDQDYRNEWKDLGLGRVYELGRPFEDVKVMTESEINAARAGAFKDEGDSSNDSEREEESRDENGQKLETGDDSHSHNSESDMSDRDESDEAARDEMALFDKCQEGVEEALKDTDQVREIDDKECVRESDIDREEREDSEDPFKWRR